MKAVTPQEIARKQEILKLKERRIEMMEGLPFLHGWKWYTWAREFFESENKLNFLCAANQISKSSTQIRKAIHWATEPSLWQKLWGRRPQQFWYLYPTSNQASIEYETKWQQFLPRGRYKTEKVIDGKPNYYQWRHEIKNKEIFAIHFDVAGVHIYFKTYAQNASALQTGTCDALFCDEELPIELYDELIFRISASDGYFHMVFTATLGQEYWRLVMEPENHEAEGLPSAAKWTVSMYDCLTYEDKTPSHWTLEKIQVVENRCKNHKEVLKRVYGRFIKDDGGRKYEQFDIKRHMVAPKKVPEDWFIYGAADIGGGGKEAHPSAICFVAVRPDFRQGVAFLGWRGDGILTTAGDVMNKFIEMRTEHKLVMTGQFYDWGCKDFETIAIRSGEAFQKAEKGQDIGEQIVNVLFKNDMITIHSTVELQKLATELSSLNKSTPKNKAKDDFCDALRYAVTQIPWDWGAITAEDKRKKGEMPPEEMTPLQQEIAERRRDFDQDGHEQEKQRIESEFAEWNELYG